MYRTTKGKLALVIMTHRHADHIAGFSRVPRFKDFTASMVWMPYWEQFNDVADSPHSLQNEIAQLAQRLAFQFGSRTDDAARMAFDQLRNATGIEFNAAGGGKLRGNAAALDILKNQLGQNGRNVRYYAAHDKPELPDELEGLSAEILGPPPKSAEAFLRLNDFKKGVGQYLDSAPLVGKGPDSMRPFGTEWEDPGHQLYPTREPYRWLKAIDYDEVAKAVEDAQPDLLAAAAASIDNFLNNQSLVVLFRFRGKNLLFVGDAQAGNWEQWLYETDTPTNDPAKKLLLTAKSRQILDSVDFYKVGHHGSTNATPIPVVKQLQETRAHKFISMCSTEPGVYGNEKKGTEVPRSPLMTAIGDESTLVRSDSFDIKLSTGVIKATAGTSLPKPKSGTLKRKDLYVEYSF